MLDATSNRVCVWVGVCGRLGFSDLPSLTWESLTGGSSIWWSPHAVRASQGRVREGKSENPHRCVCVGGGGGGGGGGSVGN
jgi:hypothetical protein